MFAVGSRIGGSVKFVGEYEQVYARYQLINELSRTVFAYQRELEVAIVGRGRERQRGRSGKRVAVSRQKGTPSFGSVLVAVNACALPVPANTHSSVIRSI